MSGDPLWCNIRQRYCRCDERCEDDSVLAVGHRCHAYFSHYRHAAWACRCGAIYRDECKTETWCPRELSEIDAALTLATGQDGQDGNATTDKDGPR